MSILRDLGAQQIRLYVHGANLDLQLEDFQRQFRASLEACRESVTFVGSYAPRDIPELMGNIDWVVVPSLWWENSPLVIQEAFMHQRPVLCSNIGGMAEKVTDGKDGLHFRVNDPYDLAETMLKASEDAGLWSRLRSGIAPVYRIEDCVEAHVAIYDALTDQKRRASSSQPVAVGSARVNNPGA